MCRPEIDAYILVLLWNDPLSIYNHFIDVQEIRQVFKAYNIDIDFRHLYLIADYMSFQGIVMPFNRYGISSSTSVIQKASFETAMNFMKNAALTGWW